MARSLLFTQDEWRTLPTVSSTDIIKLYLWCGGRTSVLSNIQMRMSLFWVWRQVGRSCFWVLRQFARNLFCILQQLRRSLFWFLNWLSWWVINIRYWNGLFVVAYKLCRLLPSWLKNFLQWPPFMFKTKCLYKRKINSDAVYGRNESKCQASVLKPGGGPKFKTRLRLFLREKEKGVCQDSWL